MDNLLKSILVFCDGACSGNPGPGGWGAIVARPQGEVLELGGSAPLTTNNQMEITAAIRALESVRGISGEVYLHTDSTNVIQGITQWIFGWKKKGWITTEGKVVANRDLWEQLLATVMTRGKENTIFWRHVRGHAGVPGNDRVDEIAVGFSKKQPPQLYRGTLLGYPIALYDIPEGPLKVPASKPKAAKTAAYSYLSLVGGIPFRHATWTECERRVKGQSGAKFKKAVSAEDEKAILSSWGIKPETIK